MISPMTVTGGVLGVLAGVGHAQFLWRSSQQPLKLHFFPLRVACVTSAFLAAAMFGGILPVFAGWSMGFAGGAAWRFRRIQG